MGEKRGKGQGSFAAVAKQQVLAFYRDVVQDLTAWQPKPPRLPPPKEELEEASELEAGPDALPLPQSEVRRMFENGE